MKNKTIYKNKTELGILNAGIELILETETVKKTKLYNAFTISDLTLVLRQRTDCACESSFKLYSVTKEELLELSKNIKELADKCPNKEI